MKVPINSIKPNPSNPRVLKDWQYQKLKKSITEFPKMLELRPIVVDDDNIILGGNMRYRILQELKHKEVEIVRASELTEEEKKRFIIADNVSFGEWDNEVLANEWDVELLSDWGLDTELINELEEEKKETEKLSTLEFDSIYYEPVDGAVDSLKDCIDMTKYNEKIKAISEYSLSTDSFEALEVLARRFIRIDFQKIADYWGSSKCSEDEKKAIERLRLVLVDGGLGGFIEDHLLKLTAGLFEEYEVSVKND